MYQNPPSRAHALAGQWVPITSSWVAAVRWQPGGLLDVRTLAGATLHYSGCSAALFDSLLNAPSTGTFVNQAVKNVCNYLGAT